MKITDLKTWVVGNPEPGVGGRYFIFLKLTTDNGIEGIGEVYSPPFSPHVVAIMIADVFERHVAGADPFAIEKLWRKVYSSAYTQHPDLSLGAVLSGIEMACWDIAGKACGQPVYNLLGGKVHERLRSYTYVYAEEGDTADAYTDPDLAAERAVACVKQGFTALKFDPTGGYSSFDPRQLSLESLERTERYTASIRDAVGPEVDLLMGTHGQMTSSSAIRLAKRLEKFDPLWLEEPTPPENSKEMARVAHATTIPVATGERLNSKYDFARVLQDGAASILQMNLGRCGGLLEAKKIAGMAETYYAQIAPHLYCGPIVGAANIQLSTCSPNFLILESIKTFGGFYAELLETPIQWEDGSVIPSAEPGLGVILDESVAESHPYTDSHLHLEPSEHCL
ncbi:MAG: mandelate racemase/muconate lactonizing enzyme family protein [Pseudomonadales bacterium]